MADAPIKEASNFFCECDGCWACDGRVPDCTCDVDWDEIYERGRDADGLPVVTWPRRLFPVVMFRLRRVM